MNSKRGPKISALVINAIRRLQDVQGSTTKEINNYISQEYEVPNKDIRRKVQVALKRGVQYGILHRDKGGYYVCKTLTPASALCDVQDDAFCNKLMGKRQRTKIRKSSCKSSGSRRRRRSRSKKRSCGCKSSRRKSRRRSSKRKCGSRRSRSRSKRRSRKMRKSCKRPRRSRSRRSRSRSKRCPRPRRPRKCNDLDMNTSEGVKEKNVNSSTSLGSEADPERQNSPNRSPDEGSD